MKPRMLIVVMLSLVVGSAAADEMEELKELQAFVDKVPAEQLAAAQKSPPSSPGDQVAVDEAEYVDSLLSLLAEGKKDSITLLSEKPLPSLVPLAEGNADLTEWAEKLRFPYARLSTAKVFGIIKIVFGMQNLEHGSMKAVLVKRDGSLLAVLFKAEETTAGVKVSVVRPVDET